MSRGLVLFLDQHARETSLKAAHGLGEDDWKGQLSNGLREIPNLRIEVQNGTFTELQKATGNSEQFTIAGSGFGRHHTFIGNTPGEIKPETSLTVRDVLSRIPDLRYIYRETFQMPSDCYKLDIQLWVDGNNKSVRVRIYQPKNSDLLNFDQISTKLRLKLPNGIVPETYDEEDQGEQATVYSFALPYQSQAELLTQVIAQLPAIQNDRGGFMFFVSPLDDGTKLSSFASLYIIAYAMSMMARYYPSTWLSITNREKGDFAYPIMKAALSLVEEKFPELILQRLQNV